ncbi:MAG: ribosomal protein L3 N(5)-glutamine methyltransferase [Cycloclasticus sp. symbiont of Bathymodiolus heckerae]|nr:MAG: ribosomal protein L3 N(5)-glutamine methyltransferase [Cycloclasticus sp. symbiont of Bathymodiolus heckerae]
MTVKLKKINTINGLIQYGAELFDSAELYYGHGTDNSMDEAAYVVLTITKNLPVSDEAIFNDDVNEVDEAEIMNIFNRRIAEKVPVAYLLGEAWFAGLPFFVNEHVLVPRSPFAELISEQFLPWIDANKVQSILDLCTGSGCIGIACAKSFPEARVDLADISAPALSVAQNNIEKHNLEERVSAIESNLFSSLQKNKYDLIVSNPPYVGHEELSALPEEFYKEPQLGLDGGVSGLDLVHEILADAPDYLNDAGVLYVEVGNTDEALQQCYPEVPFLWQEFEYGGHGVFMLTKAQLLEYKSLFQAKLNGLN